MIQRLDCKVQTYAWGKQGAHSKVAQLAQHCTTPPLTLDPGTPYAELWMGTHPTAPSTLHAAPETTLKSQLTPHHMTPAVFQRFQGDLPFLFKVLSVDKALSIQAHPDKPLAERLHRDRPQVYKDDNHKPEMAIALTPFEGLCGFQSLARIAGYMQLYPELGVVCQPASTALIYHVQATGKQMDDCDNSDMDRQYLKQVFHALMTADTVVVQQQLSALVQRLKDTMTQSVGVEALVLRLYEQYPGDVGVFCAFMLNWVRLEPGQAMFLAANEPHAYIHGDCVECMATSDNVVRAGLTPKLKDVDTLVNMLTYRSFTPASVMTQGERVSKMTTVYRVPIPEFTVMQTVLQGESKQEQVRAVQGPSLVLCVEGEGEWNDGEQMQAGCVYFVPAGTPYTLTWTGGPLLRTFQAYCELP